MFACLHYVRIDPSNVFIIHIQSGSYKANLDYGMYDVSEQEHHNWIHVSNGYYLENFVDDMASFIIWDGT